MKNTRQAGFYLSIEDLSLLNQAMSMLADFVNIVLDQTIDELDSSIEAANKELIMEGENEAY